MNYFSEIFFKVSTFHLVADRTMECRDPGLIPKDEAKLALMLIDEELGELKEAIRNNDFEEIADALGDLQYVLAGAIIRYGLDARFHEIFSEIHRNNMKRYPLVKDKEEFVKALHERYPEGGFRIIESGNRVYARREDGKILKPHGMKPNLAPLLKPLSDEEMA